MGTFLETTLDRVPAGFVLDGPLAALFAWVEENGLTDDTGDGELVGALAPPGPPYVGTQVVLRGFTEQETAEFVGAWLGDADVPVHLWPFARTGGDGSHAALWRDADGVQRIVHLGSGSGSTMVCVLAEDPVDFLRLLAIGYAEVCWPEDYAQPPGAEDGHQAVNEAFRTWVTGTYGIELPESGAEIVTTAEMGDEDSNDPFCRWVESLTG